MSVTGRLACALGVATLSGCASSAGSRLYDFDGGSSADTSTHSGNTASGSHPDAAMKLSASDAASDANGDCPESAKLVYVTGEGAKLYSLYPPTLKFTLVGTLSCLTAPTHMTVDRQGRAWVVADGNLYLASTTNASCSRVSTWTPDPSYFGDFALTFIGTKNATDNTLYMFGNSGKLGTFDVGSGDVTLIGSPVVASITGDMTTNGDGSLYFLAQTAGQTLNQIDPYTAVVVKEYVTHENGLNDQALAYYGGLFYDFIGEEIYSYDTATQATVNVGKAPLDVTGAGQSTCVPTVPPPLH